MKKIVVPVAIIVALIAFFVIVGRKEFDRHGDVQTVQSESPLTNTKIMVSASGTKPTTEVEPAAEPKQGSSVILDPPSAIPVLSPEEALIANAEALAAFAKKPESVRQQEDLHDLDFSKDVVVFSALNKSIQKKQKKKKESPPECSVFFFASVSPSDSDFCSVDQCFL